MKKLANFIVEKHKLVMVLFIVLTVLATICSRQVEINADLTKYLPDNSDMKIGMQLMEDEFGSASTETTAIRIMFTGLSADEKQEMRERLENLDFIDSVSYDSESEDYNKDEYTKYDITVAGSYGSEEETAVEAALQNDFANYESVYVVDDTAAKSIPKSALGLALCILIVILLIMSASWFEPILFVLTIGMAIILNLGTNIILGTVSNTTSSIGPILQLVLSMDYSIILIHRYHQELEKTDNKKAAMKEAWIHAFSSISSSSLTTIVGLLALVFMSFKLGRDLGIVLAKGVFISVVCVLFFLPGLTLIATPVILKTHKKVPVIPTNGLAGFSYKFRKVITPVFLALFIGMYILQQQTQLTYTMPSTDEISEVFPNSSTVVLLYDNNDEAAVTKIEEQLEDNENVISVTGYGNMIGKKNTASEMADAIEDLSSSSSDFESTLDESVLDMLYYSYFSDGEVHPMTAADFITFLADDVVNQENFAEQLDDSVKENVTDLKKFADSGKLKESMTAEDLADFLGLEEDTVKKLFLLYNIDKSDIDTGKMTVPQLVNFILDDLAKDEDYSDVLDKDKLETVENIKKFTDSKNMTGGKTYKEAAKLLDMDESTLQILYVYYYANNKDYSPDKMTIPDLVAFLKNDVLTNETFSSRFDSSISDKIDTLSKFTDKSKITSQMNSAQLADLFGISEDTIVTIFMSDTSNLSDKTMSIDEFMGFITENVFTNSAYSSSIDDSTKTQLTTSYALITAAKQGNKLTSGQMSQTLGLGEEQTTQIYKLFFMMNPSRASEGTLTIQEFVNFIVENVLTNEQYSAAINQETAAKITKMNTLINSAIDNTQYDRGQLSALSGMSEEVVTRIFALRFYDSGKTMSPQQFVQYVLNNIVTDSRYSSTLDQSLVTSMKLLNDVMNSTVSETQYDYKSAANLFSMDESTMKMLYTYKASSKVNWKISVQTLLNYIVDNSSDFSDAMDKDTLSSVKTLRKIVNSSVKGTEYTAEKMSELLDLDKDMVEKLYLLNISKNGDTSSWKMSVQKFVNFLKDDVLTDEERASQLEEDTADKIDNVKALVDAVVSEKSYSPSELYELISGFSEELEENKVELIYLYHDSKNYSESDWKLNVIELIDYIVDDLFEDTKFEAFFDDERKDSLTETRQTLRDAVESLQGENYSRVLIRVKNLTTMDSINSFYDGLSEKMSNGISGEYHFIGDSAMSYEMSKTFGSELTFITLLTAAAIFVVVTLTFKNIALPTILVLIVQCGVYIAVSIIGLQGMSLYYLTLLMVECILMGSTIDYGILFSTYYRDCRNTMDIKEALKTAYKGSIQTIMTSGSILVIVTGILSGYFPDPSVGQICRNISIGAFSASMLILFILPGVLATLDRFVKAGKKTKKNTDSLT